MARLIELADTSAWTNRYKDPEVARAFGEQVLAGRIATCEIVVLELLRSAQDHDAFTRRRARLAALPLLEIGRDVWTRATDVFQRLAEAGPLHHRRVKTPDLLVAAAAELSGVPVCHYDRDFELIAEVTGQPVRALAPLGSL